MVFNSLGFLIFFAVVLAGLRLPLSWTSKKLLLVLASHGFYAAWNPRFLFLLWLSTVVDWGLALLIAREEELRYRRALVAISLVLNLGVLAAFKYGGFIAENLSIAMNGTGLEGSLNWGNWVLPLGISFYTFEGISYVLDVYHRRVEATRSLLDYALFISFFPHLVAGPIVRARDFLPQCREERRPTEDQFSWGLTLLVLGLFQKMVLADRVFAPVSDTVFGAVGSAGTVAAWAGTVAFAGQIYCDFAGYSSCALGAALCVGLVLTENFHFPYAAVGFSDFWRRWHMSLSSWLRDYLYIPLGGNRGGTARTHFNLMLTMLIGGLWHGAAWQFVVWGGLHGLFLSGEHALRWAYRRRPIKQGAGGQFFLGLVTLFGVLVTWVFFRASSFSEAFHLLGAMFKWQPAAMIGSSAAAGLAVGVFGLLWLAQWWGRNEQLEVLFARLPHGGKVALLASLLLGIILERGVEHTFIYFQF